MGGKYGHLVRLWGLEPSQLPDPDATPENLTPLLTSMLVEAVPFIDELPSSPAAGSSSPWILKGTKKFPHSTAPVELFERTVPAEDLKPVAQQSQLPHINTSQVSSESWFLRRSVHEDAVATGTASWAEFVRNFKEEHAEAEKEFTPTVLSTSLRREWNCDGIEIELDGTTWVDWTLKLEESVHKLPAPFKKRVFPVFQATASARGRREVIIVQVAVHDLAAEARAGNDVVRGAYTSIERLREIESGRGTEWAMGTASDARGVLPIWMQKMAMPGAVSKDVNMFLDWIARERNRKAHAQPATAGDSRNGAAAEQTQAATVAES